MNMRSSSYTGRAARCMKSAFGPYTDDRLHPMPEMRVSLWQRLHTFTTEYRHQRQFSSRRTAFSIARGVAFHNCPF